MFERLPSLNSIRAFEAAARLKSFKAAAYELNVSPTAVSHQIIGLEKELCVQLFERSFRSVRLTSEGEKLASTCSRVFYELSQTLNDLRPSARKITVSATNSFSAMWLAPHLAGFQRSHPDIQVEIKATDELIDFQNDLSIDLAIRYGPVPSEKTAVSVIVKDEMGRFATPAYWKNLNPQQTVHYFITRWKNQALSVPEQSIVLDAPFGNNKMLHYFEEENQVIQAALAGQGIAIVSKILVQQSVMQGWLKEQHSGQLSQELKLCYYSLVPQRNQNNQAVLYFQKWLQQQFLSKAKAD